MSERRLYMIRHGKADHRSSRRSDTVRGPASDPPLDALGREQALALMRRLRLLPEPAAIYCSALLRARETIQPYLDATGATAAYREDLVEWHGGDWEFREFEELLGEHPEMPSRVLLQDPVFALAPNAEPVHEFRERVVVAVEEILAAHPGGDVWIVCHGGVINAYIGWILGVEDQEMFFLPANTSINTVKVDGDRRTMWFLGDDTHYTSPELFPTGDGGGLGTLGAHERRSEAVTIRFLSEEWAQAVMTAVNSDPTFAAAAGTSRARLQQVIKTADGEVHYWTTLEDGRLGLGVGDLDNTDATITQSYETAVGLAKREINPVTAFMMGKIKVDGNMGMLMGLTGVLGKLADAMAALDVEY